MDAILAFTKEFGITHAHTVKPLSQGLNSSTFTIYNHKQKFILTQLHAPYCDRTANHIRTTYELFYTHGCPLPRLYGIGNLQDHITFVTDYVDGKPEKTWSEKEYEILGTTLGIMHLVGEEGTLPTLPLITQLSLRFDALSPHIPSEFQPIKEHLLLSSYPSHLPKGIIHGDICPKNVLFTNNSISAILDWFNPTYDLLLIDIANILKKTPSRDHQDTFLESYQMVRPTSLEFLPFLIELKKISTVLYQLEQSIAHPMQKETLQTFALSNFYKCHL